MQDLLANGVSAALGGGVATLALYPLDALRTKLAADKGARASSFAVLADVIRRQGVLGLFVGVSPKLIQSMLGKFLYFVFFTGLVNRTRALGGGLPVELLCGYLAEAMHLPLTIPLEVVTTRIQKASTSAGIAATLRTVAAESGGIAGFWTGWRAYVFLCTQPMIQFIGFERLKLLWLASSGAKSLTAFEAFALGALARAIAVCCTFPFTRARTILQARKRAASDSTEKPEMDAILPLLRELVRKEGVASLYQGFYPELLRGVGSSAIMLMIKEQVAEASRAAVKAILP